MECEHVIQMLSCQYDSGPTLSLVRQIAWPHGRQPAVSTSLRIIEASTTIHTKLWRL